MSDNQIFTLRRKLWAWGDSYLICAGDDEHERYKVEAKVFSWRKQFSMSDMQDQLIYRCEGDGSWFSFNFGIYDKDDVLQGRIIQDSVWSSRNYTLQLTDGTKYAIGGNFSKTQFTFRQGNSIVAECTRPFWSFGRKYSVDISANEAHQPYILLALAAMDIILAAQQAGGAS
jgi:uncharacterized protein YxjI